MSPHTISLPASLQVHCAGAASSDGMLAQHAGLAVGDTIIAADDAPFRPVRSFQDKMGAKVTLAINHGHFDVQVAVVPTDIEPTKMFLDGMKASARIIEAHGRRIGYVHVWYHAGHAYQRTLEGLLSEAPLKDRDALIWDLRDGWGGAVPEHLAVPKEPSCLRAMPTRRRLRTCAPNPTTIPACFDPVQVAVMIRYGRYSQ